MKIEKAYKKLLIENPFYGLFLLGLSKVIDKSVETACVRKRGINCELVINPEYWETQDDIQQLNLLNHEIYHIVFQHMFLWDLFPNKEVLGLAADCEVNSYLSNLAVSYTHSEPTRRTPISYAVFCLKKKIKSNTISSYAFK